MKVSLFPCILTVIVAIVLGYLAYYLADSHADRNDVVVGIGTAVSTLLTLGCALSFSSGNDRIDTNLRTWSSMIFIVATVANLCFAAFGVAMPFYVIVVALLLVIHLGVVWKLASIKDV